MHKKKGFIKLILCLLAVFIISCALPGRVEVRSAAYIDEKNSAWEIKHPHDNATGSKLDFLKSKNMTIWLRFSNQGKWFDIDTKFIEITDPIEFSSSRISLKLSNGEVVTGKAISCYNRDWDLESLRLYSSVTEPVNIEIVKKYDVKAQPCYSLFYDRPAPSVDEEFIMYMNDAFTANGKNISLPPIHFRKTSDRIIRLGICVQ